MRVYLQIEKRAIKPLTVFQKNSANIDIPVGLAVRSCGSHPQVPGSTPGLVNLFIFPLIFPSYKLLRSIEFFKFSLKLYRLQELKLLKNFKNRSEQKTCACLSSNRRTCHLGAHCIRKKITFNLDNAVGLAVRICGFTNKTRVGLPKWKIY